MGVYSRRQPSRGSRPYGPSGRRSSKQIRRDGAGPCHLTHHVTRTKGVSLKEHFRRMLRRMEIRNDKLEANLDMLIAYLKICERHD